MDDIWSIIAYSALVFLLLLSFYFSIAETAFTALNRIWLKNMVKKGSKRARLTLVVYDDYDRLLSSLLIGTNFSNIAFTAICTMLFVEWLGAVGATAAAVFTTAVIVVFAEVSPKTLAMQHPEKIAMFCAPLAKFFMILFMPLNAFFRWWQNALKKLFKSPEQTMTEDDLLSIVDEAEHIGVIDEEDKELIHNVIEFYGQKAHDVLTPRIDLASISKDATVDEIANLFFETGFSRIPVYDKSIDDITGILHTRDFLNFVIRQDKPFKSIITPAVFVPSQMDISDLFTLLQNSKTHMAVVVDEYGGTSGVVTMEDIMEEIMGEIWDESDKVIEPFTRLSENSHKVLCATDTHEFFEYFNLPSDDSDDLPPTVNGLLLNKLGRIPTEGDCFDYEHLTITISKAEKNRALECTVIVNELSPQSTT